MNTFVTLALSAVLAVGCGARSVPILAFSRVNPKTMLDPFALLDHGIPVRYGFCRSCEFERTLDPSTAQIPAQFDYAEPFCEDSEELEPKATVVIDFDTGKAKTLTVPGPPRTRLALVARRDKAGVRRYGYIDESGGIVIALRFVWASSFHAGRAIVQFEDGAIALIDKNGAPRGLVNAPDGPLAGLRQLQSLTSTLPRKLPTIAGRDERGWGFLTVDDTGVRFANAERWEELAYVRSRDFVMATESRIELKDKYDPHPFPYRGRRGALWYIIDPVALADLQGLGNERGFRWIGHTLYAGFVAQYGDGEVKVMRGTGRYNLSDDGRRPHETFGLTVTDVATALREAAERGDQTERAYHAFMNAPHDDPDSGTAAFMMASHVGDDEFRRRSHEAFVKRMVADAERQAALDAEYARKNPAPPASTRSLGSGNTWVPVSAAPDPSAETRSMNAYKNWLNEGSWDRSRRPN